MNGKGDRNRSIGKKFTNNYQDIKWGKTSKVFPKKKTKQKPTFQIKVSSKNYWKD